MVECNSQWLVSQIGGREHYGVARALAHRGMMSGLLTDFWIPPHSIFSNLRGLKRLADRYHPELSNVPVMASNMRMLAFELGQRAKRRSGWASILERNALFQKLAVREIGRRDIRMNRGPKPTLFSYSYAALELFREAKKRGWTTVLGQIDPGPEEDVLVEQLRAENPNWARLGASSPPENYWKMWREECALADRIIVNSAWSKSLMEKAGINASKIEIIPLAYEIPTNAAVAGNRKLQSRNSSAPLRVLFLGQAIVRKGIQDLAEAARQLESIPIRIDVVGPHGCLPDGLPSNLIFHGPVPRSEASSWYAQADVFVLPTHSDGFALTQLEAMAQGVPVIATPACGEVVVDGVNGWLVPPRDPDALADRMRWMFEHRDQHSPMSEAARKRAAEFSLDRVAEALVGESDEKS